MQNGGGAGTSCQQFLIITFVIINITIVITTVVGIIVIVVILGHCHRLCHRHHYFIISLQSSLSTRLPLSFE